MSCPSRYEYNAFQGGIGTQSTPTRTAISPNYYHSHNESGSQFLDLNYSKQMPMKTSRNQSMNKVCNATGTQFTNPSMNQTTNLFPNSIDPTINESSNYVQDLTVDHPINLTVHKRRNHSPYQISKENKNNFINQYKIQNMFSLPNQSIAPTDNIHRLKFRNDANHSFWNQSINQPINQQMNKSINQTIEIPTNNFKNQTYNVTENVAAEQFGDYSRKETLQFPDKNNLPQRELFYDDYQSEWLSEPSTSMHELADSLCPLDQGETQNVQRSLIKYPDTPLRSLQKRKALSSVKKQLFPKTQGQVALVPDENNVLFSPRDKHITLAELSNSAAVASKKSPIASRQRSPDKCNEIDSENEVELNGNLQNISQKVNTKTDKTEKVSNLMDKFKSYDNENRTNKFCSGDSFKEENYNSNINRDVQCSRHQTTSDYNKNYIDVPLEDEFTEDFDYINDYVEMSSPMNSYETSSPNVYGSPYYTFLTQEDVSKIDEPENCDVANFDFQSIPQKFAQNKETGHVPLNLIPNMTDRINTLKNAIRSDQISETQCKAISEKDEQLSSTFYPTEVDVWTVDRTKNDFAKENAESPDMDIESPCSASRHDRKQKMLDNCPYQQIKNGNESEHADNKCLIDANMVQNQDALAKLEKAQNRLTEAHHELNELRCMQQEIDEIERLNEAEICDLEFVINKIEEIHARLHQDICKDEDEDEDESDDDNCNVSKNTRSTLNDYLDKEDDTYYDNMMDLSMSEIDKLLEEELRIATELIQSESRNLKASRQAENINDDKLKKNCNQLATSFTTDIDQIETDSDASNNSTENKKTKCPKTNPAPVICQNHKSGKRTQSVGRMSTTPHQKLNNQCPRPKTRARSVCRAQQTSETQCGNQFSKAVKQMKANRMQCDDQISEAIVKGADPAVILAKQITATLIRLVQITHAYVEAVHSTSIEDE